MTQAVARVAPEVDQRGPVRSSPSRLTASRVRTAWLFLAPMLAVLSFVAVYPLLKTFWFSLTDANLLRLEDARYIGLKNYLSLGERTSGVLADPGWWQAVRNTLVFALWSVGLETVLGFAVALVLNAKFPLRGVVRAAVLVPWAIPTIVSAKMWSWMLNDQFGIVNDLFLRLGLISQAHAWTADPSLVMVSVVMVDVWKTTPFMALLILAALQMLPEEIYEAAKLDGIHPVRVFWKVTLPLVRPALMVAVIFRFLDALRVFDLIYVLTTNSRQTMTMSVYARQYLSEYQQVGYGSAAATILFFVIAIVTAVYVTAGRVRFQEA